MASNEVDANAIRSIYNMFLGCFRGNINYMPIPSNTVSQPNAIGVARVVIQVANIKRKLLKPRPFVVVRVQGRSETRTSTIEAKTNSPTWFSESAYIIIYSLQDNLDFEILNHHRFIRTGIIGHSPFPLILLEDESRRMGEELPIIKNGRKNTGTILFDVFYYPVSYPAEIVQTSNTGIVTLRIQGARNFKWDSYARKPSKLIAITSLGWTDAPLHRTDASHHSDFPVWNSVFDFLCFDKTSTVIVVKIIEQQKRSKTIVYGHLSLALEELVAAPNEEREWWPLSGCPDGELRVRAEWKSIEMDRNSIYKSS